MACSAKTPSPTCRRLVEGGVIGFKLYMGNTFGNIPSPSTGAMLEAFEVVAPTGKRISLHAETNSIMERRQKRLMAAGKIDQFAHLAARPAVVAVEAVSRAAILAEWTGARIHILHISSADELRPLREAKARGVDITGETCPHYLLLSTDDYARVPGVIAVNPPVREARNRNRSGRRCSTEPSISSPPTTRRTRRKKRPATTSGPSTAASPAWKRRCR